MKSKPFDIFPTLWTFLAAVSSLLCFLTVSCEKQKQKDFSTSKPVHVAEIIQGEAPVYTDSIGILNPDLSVDIRSQATGKIDNCYFAEGQYVKKGDLLFTIDSQLYKALLDQSKATLLQDMAVRNLAKFVVDKNKTLPTSGAMAVQDYAKNIAKLEEMEAKVELGKTLIRQNEIKLEYCKIASPIDGITGYRQVDPGNIVTENSGSILVNIKKIDPLNIDFTIPEKNMELLKTSMKKGELQIVATIDNFNAAANTISKKYYGRLEVLDNAINTATGTISLRGIIPNKNRELWPGQFAKIKLIFFYNKNSLLIPYQSVAVGLKGEYVFCIKNEKACLYWIKTGLRYGDYIVVDSFLGNDKFSPVDKIVTIGQMGLISGDKVNIVGKDSFYLPKEEKNLSSSGETNLRNN